MHAARNASERFPELLERCVFQGTRKEASFFLTPSLKSIWFLPVLRQQRPITALPLRPHRSAVWANSLNPSPHLSYLSFCPLTKRTTPRLWNPSPVLVFPILIPGRHDARSFRRQRSRKAIPRRKP